MISVNNGTFQNCHLLSSIPHESIIEFIGSFAFRSCWSLQSVYLSNVSYIGYAAFCNCSLLQSVYILSSIIPSLNATTAFDATPISRSTYLGYFGSIFVP